MISLEELVRKVDDIPVFPHTVTKIINLTDNPDSSIDDIEKEILMDSSLTARVLRMANSAYYGVQRKISTVSDAVILLGFQAVKSMVLSATVSKIMAKELPGYGFQRDALWKQSLAAAICARLIARKARYSKPDQAYIAGLLRDIGKVILDYYLTEQYKSIIEMVDSQNISFVEAEEKILGYNHGEIGAKIAEKWNLPQELVEAIAHHHDPEAEVINPKLVAITHVADAIVMMVGIHLGSDGLSYGFSSQAMEILGLDEFMLQDIMSELVNILADEELIS
ncbi:MAG: HDOD domain-containing protein [Clostridiales bacterium]|nr:HDOD domain-containing protein [Clostridiales bacterium]